MKNEIRYGGIKYLSFVLLDIICLILANVLAFWIYSKYGTHKYSYADYRSIVAFMVGIDLLVTIVFNTLKWVLRRRKRREILESIKHIGISFALLSAVLFTAKQGAEYSRVTVYLSYGIDFILLVVLRLLWRNCLRLFRGKGQTGAMLMTTDSFVDEGLKELERRGIQSGCVFLLKNIGRNEISGIQVAKDEAEAEAIICWKWMEKVYIYGLDHQMIPKELTSACKEMKVEVDSVDFEYRVIDVKTIHNEDPKYGSLSFLEGKRDIPFPIRRVYWITETEASLHRGFHAHKLNCQLLFCPHGKIDIILDDGREKTTVTLEGAGKGLLLMPGMWREMVWRETGSVLCVLASEYYDPDEYIRDYDEFIAYKGLDRIGA